MNTQNFLEKYKGVNPAILGKEKTAANGRNINYEQYTPYVSAGLGLVDNLITSGGKYSTTGGRALNTAGDGLLMTGNPYAMAAGAILKIGGTVVNRGFGNNDEAFAQTNAHINSALNTRIALGGTLNVAKQVANLQNYRTVARGNYGWFRGSDYNRDKSREAQANQFMFASARNAIDNTNSDTLDWANKNYTHSVAFGGPLNHNKALGGSFGGLLGFIPQQGGAIDYEWKNRFLNNMQSGVNNKSYNYTAMPSGAVFFNGGGLGYGSNFTDGLIYVDKGGTHEENPYGGVKMGVAADGQPDLVEEDEVIYNDYVYSNRLRVPIQNKKKHRYAQGGMLGELQPQEDPYMQKVLKKYEGMTYADAAKKADRISGADERQNDKKAIAARDVELEILKDSQEIQRQQQEMQRIQQILNNMSPQELMALQAEMQQQQQNAQYAQEAQMQQQAMQEQAAQEAQMQGVTPEDMMYSEQMPQPQAQELQFPQETAMQPQQPIDQRFSAYGGHLHAAGDTLHDIRRDKAILEELAKQQAIQQAQMLQEADEVPVITETDDDQPVIKQLSDGLVHYIFKQPEDLYNGKLMLNMELLGNRQADRESNTVADAIQNHNAIFGKVIQDKLTGLIDDIKTAKNPKDIQEKRKKLQDFINNWNELNTAYSNMKPDDKKAVGELQRKFNDLGLNINAVFDNYRNLVGQKTGKNYKEIKDGDINNFLDQVLGNITANRFLRLPRLYDGENLTQEQIEHNQTVENLYKDLKEFGVTASPWSRMNDSEETPDLYNGSWFDKLEYNPDIEDVIQYTDEDGNIQYVPADEWLKQQMQTEGSPFYGKSVNWKALTPGQKAELFESAGDPIVHSVRTDWRPYIYNNKPITQEQITPNVDEEVIDRGEKFKEDADPFPKIPQSPFYAGLGLQGAGLLATLLSKTNYLPYNQVGAPSVIAPDRVGPYAKYIPTDKNALMEIANANAANQRALAANMSGGNGATAFANMLASDAQRQAAINDAFIKADAANRERAMAADAHNLKVDVANAESGLKAAMANQDTNTKYTAMTTEDNLKRYALNNAMDQEKSKAISAGLTGIGNLIYTGANNRWNQEMLAWANRNGTYAPQRAVYGRDGKTIQYYNDATGLYETRKAQTGGQLKRKRRKRNKGLSI